jgi:trans-2,3-dihydro-3-hydroxyanthranilate isomerase
MVESCLRDGVGGSPTAVAVNCDGLADADLMLIPPRTGASHVAAVYSPAAPGQNPPVRFFTCAGELPGCGHGTVAAIAVLALRGARDGFCGWLRVAGRDLEVSSSMGTGPDGNDVVTAWFDQGVVSSRDVTSGERDAFLAALGLDREALHPDHAVTVASPGRERLLIPVVDRAVLARIRPDQEQLAVESRRFGQLGCFVYVPPSLSWPAAARMFAPAIGVPEDVANANSTGCLAAGLLLAGHDPTVVVDQGDALGRPSSVYATAERTERGVATRVGGVARVLPADVEAPVT